jgi:hypothetical protein
MHHTSHNHTLRLPASEYAKLVSSRSRDHGHTQPVADLASQAADIVHARARRARHVNHLFGFARA